ncbi:MAG TPA: transglutaminase family protein, partial [Kofleriaceae bacterium]|nr:transglutaminase family protein [Kofleriaceae bacterium]
VNLPPAYSAREAADTLATVFDAALATGLTAERYMLDGRAAGSGGGNHITIGASRPERSPWLVRPELLASLVTFTQHHPSLSYLFSGLFVGPTSQAPRVDEARHDALYELEIALPRLYESPPPPAWQVDALLRHLLVDVAGSTHRAEISIDKLLDPQTPYGRQGLVELRAFEMPPHPRMAAAQVVLVRALVAAFASAPYRHPLVRWGSALHDRFLLPYYLWRDFEDVLAYLAERGVALPADGYRPFVELRCPLVGAIAAGDARLEVRNAIEPWHVLGEEATQTGTARYVDSSVERIELRAIGLDAARFTVAVNGVEVPLRETSGPDVRVGGVRFRAWCPPHALHPHLGIHHPLRIEIVDTWAARGVAAGTYHVWHPEGRAFDAPPLTRVEAAARRAQRFTLEGPGPAPRLLRVGAPSAEQPHTLDLRRIERGAPMPRPADWTDR